MTHAEFVRAFDALPLPQPSTISSCSFSAIPLELDNAHKLGKDEGGCPCLLVSTGPSTKARMRVPLVLENLAVLFDLRCHVSAPGRAAQPGTFTVIKCVSADGAVRSHFLALLPGISAALGRTSDKTKIASVVEDIVELFRALSAIPMKEVQGLWGELLLIHQAKDAITLAEAWHAESTDRYDFNRGAERIDAKTASRQTRRHHFTLEQLIPPEGTRLLIASMFVESSGAGASVFDLLEALRARLGREPQLHLRITRLAHQTLGTAWQMANNIRFDVEAARQSLRYFDSSSIPRVTLPLPENVSEVRFVADLEKVKALVPKDLSELGLFGTLPS
jgi:hypothetical protein